MKILFISPVFPDSNLRGVERRAWSHWQSLARLGDVRLVVFQGERMLAKGEKEAGPNSLREQAAKIVFAQSGQPPRSLPGQLWETLRYGTQERRPLTRPLEESMAALLGSHFDLVFCFRMRSHPIWLRLRSQCDMSAARLIVDFDDIESRAKLRSLKEDAGNLGKGMTLDNLLLGLHLYRDESRVMKAADAVIVCSEGDKALLMRRSGSQAAIWVVPNTMPAKPQLPEPSFSGDIDRHILFVGTMNYPPNADAVRFFVTRLLPELKARADRPFRVSLVGFDPPADIVAFGGDPVVEVTGGVPDVEEYYRQAHIVVVPMRFGGGTRIKILEAMAYGRPVVSTTIGAEGLDVTHGENILIADDPEAFAAAITRLCGDEELWRKLVANGRRLVEAHYSVDAADRVMTQLATGSAGR